MSDPSNPSDLRDLILTSNRSSRGPECTTYLALQQMDAADREVLEELMYDLTIRHTALAAGFKSLGYPIHADSISRHRRGECACAKRRAAVNPNSH